jgi:tetratricopeptide (TPR) repeat protein
MSNENKNPWTTPTWIAIAVVSILWWVIASQHCLWRFVLVVALSLAAFMVGCLVGFLFTSYGEEASSVGKVRDWLIGGITGLTIAKAGAIKGLLLTFAVGPGPKEFALAASAAIIYSVLGFLFMFFQRELILNVMLAESRAERGKLEGSKEAGQVVQRFLLKLPASVLSGVDDIDEITEVNAEEAKGLRDLLYSEDVDNFLKQAEEAAKGGIVDWDVASKTAYISYYRTYFEKGDKLASVDKALEWILRALNMNPLHVDLTMKYADMLGASNEYDAAIAVLERLASRPEAPMLVKQWLGYFLLEVPSRLNDAIEYSHEYLNLFPDDQDAPFNLACAYAQMYCEELKSAKKESDPQSINRSKAIENLAEALKRDPDYAETVRTKWTEKGDSFDCFGSDPEFQQLVVPKSPSRTEKIAKT